MDVDVQDDLAPTPTNVSTPVSRRDFVVVDDAHPFDLDAYISNYTGRTALERLCHIITHCPGLAIDAYSLTIKLVQETRDTTLYDSIQAAYERISTTTGVDLPPAQDIAAVNASWLNDTKTNNKKEKSKLELELRTYTNNMIKESIRMANRDLGHFYRSVGDHHSSYKHYTKSREYCTTSQHILEMCLSVLELLIEQRNFSHIPTYIYKAEAAIEAVVAANSPSAVDKTTAGSGGVTSAGAAAAPTPSVSKKSSLERDKVRAKLDLASGLSFLSQSNYEKAAYHFVRVGPAKYLDDWIGKIIAPGDIAVYGTLCALASYTRGAIKAQILQNSVFGVYIEQEPYVRELIEAHMSSNFKGVLGLLSRYYSRHSLDIHLSGHLKNITNLIRDWAVVLYFQPFSSIKLTRMSQAFGWSLEEVEEHVVASIRSGAINGRVDKQNKVLQATVKDPRAELFGRALQAGSSLKNANRKLLLRMRLQQADLVVRNPKQNQQQQRSEQAD